MINVIYERNGQVFDYINCRSKKFLDKWIRALGAIKIIRIWES